MEYEWHTSTRVVKGALQTGCIELVSVNANTSLDSSGKRRRSSEAAEENMMPNGQISPGKMHFLDEAKQVLKIKFYL